MKKKLLLLFFSITLLVPTAAHAHFNTGTTKWSVDAGEIRWGGSTKYLTAWNHSKAQWNELGLIYIAPDNAFVIEDLTLSDYNDSSSPYWAYWGPNAFGSDALKFNDYRMVGTGMTLGKQKDVALHELGHALGLAHSYSPNVMEDFVTERTVLGSHDIADYGYLW